MLRGKSERTVRGTWLGLICVSLAWLGASAHAMAASARFDGQWSAFLSCSASRGAAAYHYEFDVVIHNGVLHGERKHPGEPGYLTLDGTVQDDGSAVLTGRGLTGMEAYSVGHVVKQTPYLYHVDAMFGATSGKGTRTEIRPCTYTFTKG